MNSAQRRKRKRSHPHTIVIQAVGNRTYYKYDEKVYLAVLWCKKHVKGTWRMNSVWDHAEFIFSNREDASWFALKWI